MENEKIENKCNVESGSRVGYTPSYSESLIGHNGPMMNVFGNPDRSKYWTDGEWMTIDNRVCGLSP